MSQYLGSRFRTRIEPVPTGDSVVFGGERFIETSPFSNVWNSVTQISGPHPFPYFVAESCWDDLHPGPPYRSGGPFRRIRIEYLKPRSAVVGEGTYITNSSNHTVSGVGHGRMKWVGGFSTPSTYPWSPEIAPGANLDLALGKDSGFVPDLTTLRGKVWSRTKPPIEHGGLFVAMRELKDLPRMLSTSAGGFAKSWKFFGGRSTGNIMLPKEAADHFLNHNFGWVPFIKDLKSTIDNVVEGQARIEHIKRDNGTWVRRRATLVNQEYDEPVPGWSGTGVHGFWPANVYPVNDCYTGTPTWSFRVKGKVHASSVGMFRYYLPYFDSQNPEFGGILGPIRRQLALHGARISPVNVYKSTPWTWLVDWFTDTGRTVSALSDELTDQLAAKYLFLSHRDYQEITCRQVLPFNSDSGGTKTFEWTRIIDVKQREQADSPYGFGPSWDSLSPKQLAILGALGLTRIG